MGPRLESRGENSLAYQVHAPQGSLQWGRGSKAAESTSRRQPFLMATLLQWGRGSKAAESSRQVVPSLETHTASMGPRLESRGEGVADDIYVPECWLQWGRGSKAAESAMHCVQKSDTAKASMGPRLESRGETSGHIESGRRINASMGPRLESRGELSL